MPRDVILGRRAQNWVDDQLEYLGARNPALARRLLDRIATARRQLADFPQSGVRTRVPGTRRLIMTPYILTYREVEQDRVIILDIRHGRQREAPLPGDV